MFRITTLILSVFAFCANAEENPSDLNAYGSFVHSASVPNALFFVSAIEDGDLFEFRRALRIHDIDTVVLASPGGSVWEGLSMAGIIFDRGLSTYVPQMQSKDAGCFSACAYMFFAGAKREAVGSLGVHQVGAYDKEVDANKRAQGETQQITQFTTSEIIGFLNEFGTPPWVYERMFRSREIYVFSEEERASLNLGEIDQETKLKVQKFLKHEVPKIVAKLENEIEREPESIFLDVSNKDLVQLLQRELNAVKCAAGPVDGSWGPRTNQAAERFAKQNKVGFEGPGSDIKPFLQVLAAKSRQDCPPLPKPTKKSFKLASDWSFGLVCRGRRLAGYARMGYVGTDAKGVASYRIYYENNLGGRYQGTVWTSGLDLVFDMQMIGGRQKSQGVGRLAGNRRSVAGQSSDGCDFYAEAR